MSDDLATCRYPGFGSVQSSRCPCQTTCRYFTGNTLLPCALSVASSGPLDMETISEILGINVRNCWKALARGTRKAKRLLAAEG
jgi:hypothetical protein